MVPRLLQLYELYLFVSHHTDTPFCVFPVDLDSSVIIKFSYKSQHGYTALSEITLFYPFLHTPRTTHDVYARCIIFSALWNRE